jgi:hypothetical protein
MLVRELFEVTQAWGRKGGHTVRKFRCTSGVRKGRVMSSPAACNKPLNIKKSTSFKQTKHRKGGTMKMKSALTKRTSSASKRLRTLNKPRRATRRGRRIS